MVLAYLGIILFLLVGNKVKFIADSPVRRAERAQVSDRWRDSLSVYAVEASRVVTARADQSCGIFRIPGILFEKLRAKGNAVIVVSC